MACAPPAPPPAGGEGAPEVTLQVGAAAVGHLDHRAAAPAQRDQPRVAQLGVSAIHRVQVDGQIRGEVAGGGEDIAVAQLAPGDRLDHLLAPLLVDGPAIAEVDRQHHGSHLRRAGATSSAGLGRLWRRHACAFRGVPYGSEIGPPWTVAAALSGCCGGRCNLAHR